MTTKKDLLTGRWQFIGAESYVGISWQPSKSYVKEMVWEFQPTFFSDDKLIGNIVESVPVEESVEMAYTYNTCDDLLNIEVIEDGEEYAEDDSKWDIYSVTFDTEQPARPIIKLSILTQHNCPPPYFRYILQKIE